MMILYSLTSWQTSRACFPNISASIVCIEISQPIRSSQDRSSRTSASSRRSVCERSESSVVISLLVRSELSEIIPKKRYSRYHIMQLHEEENTSCSISILEIVRYSDSCVFEFPLSISQESLTFSLYSIELR